MTYIIQHRLVRICYNEKDLGEQLKELFFPSIRQVAALTAFLTAITTTSCMGCGPIYM